MLRRRIFNRYTYCFSILLLFLIAQSSAQTTTSFSADPSSSIQLDWVVGGEGAIILGIQSLSADDSYVIVAAGNVAGMTISQLSVLNRTAGGALGLVQTLALDSSVYRNAECFGPLLRISAGGGRVAMLCDYAIVEVVWQESNLSVSRVAYQSHQNSLYTLSNSIVPQTEFLYFTSQSINAASQYLLETLDINAWQLEESVISLPSATSSFIGFFVDEASQSLVAEIQSPSASGLYALSIRQNSAPRGLIPLSSPGISYCFLLAPGFGVFINQTLSPVLANRQPLVIYNVNFTTMTLGASAEATSNCTYGTNDARFAFSSDGSELFIKAFAVPSGQSFSKVQLSRSMDISASFVESYLPSPSGTMLSTNGGVLFAAPYPYPNSNNSLVVSLYI